MESTCRGRRLTRGLSDHRRSGVETLYYKWVKMNKEISARSPGSNRTNMLWEISEAKGRDDKYFDPVIEQKNHQSERDLTGEPDLQVLS